MKLTGLISILLSFSLACPASLWATPRISRSSAAAAVASRSSGASLSSDTTPSPQSISEALYSNAATLTQLITAASYIAGLGFMVGAIMKFKMHKDDPKQVPIGTPVSLVIIGGMVLFVPTTAGATAVAKTGPYGTVEPY